jgi:hypothetical protein
MTPDREKWEKVAVETAKAIARELAHDSAHIPTIAGVIQSRFADAIEKAVDEERKRHIHDKPLREAVKELGQQVVEKQAEIDRLKAENREQQITIAQYADWLAAATKEMAEAKRLKETQKAMIEGVWKTHEKQFAELTAENKRLTDANHEAWRVANTNRRMLLEAQAELARLKSAQEVKV